MYMNDPFIRLAHSRRGRRIRWRWGWKRPGPGARVHLPYRRRLAAIERALTADTPALSAKFAVFNQLTEGERAAGAEQLPGRARPWAGRAHVAVVLAVTVFAALCVMLSLQGRRTLPPCPVAAAAGAGAYLPVRGLPCRAYPSAR